MKCPVCGNELQRSNADPKYGMCLKCKKAYKWQEEGAGAADSGGLNVCLLISFILGVLYLLYTVVHWLITSGSASNGFEQLGVGIGMALVMPHIVCTVIAVIFNALGLFLNKRGFSLTGAILYTVAMVLFPLYFMFVIIEMILSYIGFARQNKSGGGKVAIVIVIIVSILLAGLFGAFLLFSGGDESETANISENSENQNDTGDASQEIFQKNNDGEYSIGETWTVDGKWSLTVDSIAETADRNQFEERNPAQVFIINYTYENLGEEDGVYFDLSGGQIVDSTGLMGYSYPGSVSNNPQNTPVGARCAAQDCVAVDNVSSEIRIIVTQYDNNFNSYTATFVMPIG